MTWVASSPGSYAQQQRLPAIGFLNTGSEKQYTRLLGAFKRGLQESGLVEGESLKIEYRWANNRRELLEPLVKELLSGNVDLIAATGGSPAALAAKAATTTIPIVFAIGVDPVRIGLVSSLAQPGANITGGTMLAAELSSKRLELLSSIVPGAKSFAALINPKSPATPGALKDLQEGGKKLGHEIHIVNAAGKAEYEAAFEKLSGLGADALVIGADPLFNNDAEHLAELCMHYRMPAIYQFSEFVSAGGLMSYGGAIEDTYQQAGAYSGQILKGAKPSDLPVQQVARVRLIINLKSAKALGIAIPITILGRADEVIE
jgi:putative ABC transport system substrate-binding protein